MPFQLFGPPTGAKAARIGASAKFCRCSSQVGSGVPGGVLAAYGIPVNNYPAVRHPAVDGAFDAER